MKTNRLPPNQHEIDALLKWDVDQLDIEQLRKAKLFLGEIYDSL